MYTSPHLIWVIGRPRQRWKDDDGDGEEEKELFLKKQGGETWCKFI
jgi:hypothetical protein